MVVLLLQNDVHLLYLLTCIIMDATTRVDLIFVYVLVPLAVQLRQSAYL